MRNYYLWVLCACTIFSCSQIDKGPTVVQTKVDSLNTEIQLLKDKLTQYEGSSSKNENFDSFLFNFMTDSLFQITRVKFPIQYVHWKDDYPGGEIDTVFLDVKSWKHESLYFNDFSAIPQTYDNFQMALRPTSERLIHFTGVETGVNAKYFFKAINEKWYLIKMENLGD